MDRIIRQTSRPLRGGRWTVQALLSRAILIVLLACAASGLTPLAAWGEEPEIVARVNGEPVTQGELQRILTDPLTQRAYRRETGIQEPDSQELARWTLRQLIIQRLSLQEAARREFKVAEADLDQAVAGWRARFRSKPKFQRWLKARALDERSLRETIRTDILVSRVRAALVEGVRLTEEQVQSYYQAHKEELQLPEEVRLRFIAVKTKAEADSILTALQKGEDFERLARERSMESRAAQIGDMRWASLQSLPPPLREAVSALKPGDIGGPLQGSAEFIIVRLEERRPARTKSLAEAREEIERSLLPAKRQEVFQKWLAEQEQKSRIEVFLQPGSTNKLVVIPPNQLMALEEKEP